MACSILIENLSFVPYRDIYNGKQTYFNISNEKTAKAISEEIIEDRSFQGNLDEILDDCNKVSNYSQYLLKLERYHCLRIAHLIKYGEWKNPILVKKDKKTIYDGQHRLLAAKYLGMTEIDAIVINDELDDKKLKDLWKKINELNGDVIRALKELNISFCN